MNKLSFISSIPSDNDTTIYLVPTNSQKSLQFFNVELNMHFYDLSGNSRLTIPVNANDDGVYFKLSQLSSLGLGTYAFYLSMRYSDHMEYYPSNTAKYITLAYNNNRLVFKSIFTPEATNITPPDTSKIVERQVLHVHDIDIKDIKVSTIDSNKNANVYLDQYDVLHFDIPKGETGKSLYELARDAGFTGSFKDYEKTLVGPTGPKGDRGYNIWFDIHDYGENYRGSYWTDLKGSAPDRGPQVSDLVVLSSGHLVQVTGVSYGGVPEAGGGTFNYGPYLANLAVATGSQGSKGDKGDKGDRGATGPQGPKGDTGDRGPRGFSIIPIKSTLGGNLSDIDYSSLFFDPNIVPNVGDYLLEKNGDLVEVTEVYYDNNTLSSGNIIGSLKGPIGRTGENGKDGLSAYQLAINNGFKGTEKEWLDSLKVSNESSARHAPTGWTLDRTTNPWTIWFDNGCGLQIPEYGTLATIYGYGFPANVQNTSLDIWPVVGGIMSASHGTLTLDAISKTIDHADYWGPNTTVINPIRTDAGDYDWSNVYFNDGSRDRKGQYQSDRQKVMLRVMYELGIFSVGDLKPFGLVQK